MPRAVLPDVGHTAVEANACANDCTSRKCHWECDCIDTSEISAVPGGDAKRSLSAIVTF